MMREAQKMMQDPAFQERMKQITERPEFKESMSKTQEMMKYESKVSTSYQQYITSFGWTFQLIFKSLNI